MCPSVILLTQEPAVGSSRSPLIECNACQARRGPEKADEKIARFACNLFWKGATVVDAIQTNLRKGLQNGNAKPGRSG